MHPDPNGEDAAIRDAQATYAERLSAEAGPRPTTRLISLDDVDLAAVEYDADEHTWQVVYLDGTRPSDSLLGEAEDLEEADRHGIGVVADALARGVIAAPGSSEGGR